MNIFVCISYNTKLWEVIWGDFMLYLFILIILLMKYINENVYVDTCYHSLI